jgi:hypothetical protein
LCREKIFQSQLAQVAMALAGRAAAVMANLDNLGFAWWNGNENICANHKQQTSLEV